MKLYVALITIIVVVFTQASMAQKIKFATLAPKGSTYMKVLEEYAAEVTELTGGKVTFKIYPSGIQGDEKDVLRKMKFGQIHSAGFTGVGLGEINPETRILELPMLFQSYEEVDHITELLYDELSAGFEEKGFINLGWADVGFAYVYSQKPIASIGDLKGTKMWMWEGDPVAEATFQALGVSAIPLSITDVLTSLQTNLIEGVYAPPLPCVALQWHTRIKTITELPLANVAGAVLITRKMFNKIPPEHQEIMLKKGKEHFYRLVQLGREDNAESIELMKQNGVEMVTVADADLTEFVKLAKTAHNSLAGKLYEQSLLDRVNSALEEFRAEKAQK